MLDRFLKLNLAAKLLPAALILYLFLGFAGTTSIKVGSGSGLLCERSYDFGSFAGAIVAVIGAAFLYRIAKHPRTAREQGAAGGHRIVSGVLAVLAIALVADGVTTKVSTSSPAECREIADELGNDSPSAPPPTFP